MKFSGETVIAAPIAKVWEALNDPAVLKASIPGCDSLEPTDNGGFAAVVRQKIGPVSATFEGDVSIEDANAPYGYRLVGKGSGGVAGFAKGSAVVSLTETALGTQLNYDAEAQLGGKIAQLGGRLISSVAAKVAADFFATFGEQVTGKPAIVSEAPHRASAMRRTALPTSQTIQSQPSWRLLALAGWATAAILAIVLLLEKVAELL